MSTTFPRVRGGKRGYDIDEVEDFLEDARRAFSGEPTAAPVTSEMIRRAAFHLRRGGYAPAEVDAALERLEDAFAVRERERDFAQRGEQAVYTSARAAAQTILDRAVRPRGQRFRRVGAFTPGYSVAEVDAVADRVASYIQHGTPLDLAELRRVAFAAQRGGYREGQVDLFLDAVAQIMLAVR